VDQHKTTVERAFEIADLGTYIAIEDICAVKTRRLCLRATGWTLDPEAASRDRPKSAERKRTETFELLTRLP
jgi:hypothetical protein